MSTGLPITCARCPRSAVVVVEAGTPTSRTRRAATACPRHIATMRRWCARSGLTRLIPVGPTTCVQPALIALSEVTP